jgi:hypothetical protein
MDAKDEGTVRTLLRAIADTPEPPSSVDVAAARRHGSRRLWIRRAALPALALVAVAGALTVPRGLVSDHPERTVATPQPPATSPVVDSPWLFDPLVPYASFGWLPPGFSESAANNIVVNQGVTSATDFVSREAAAPAAGQLLYLQVNARGTCAVTPAYAEAGILAAGSEQVTCTDASFDMTGTAPAVDGQPAFWTNDGSGVAWEYRPGAWAELSAFKIGASQALPPSAATKALLLRVAAHVSYGDTTPLTFAFRLSGGLPAGWQLWRASFTVSGGRMAGSGVTAGPAVDTSALTINASISTPPAACDSPAVTGESTSSVARLGLRWLYRKVDLPDYAWQQLCATRPVDGLTGVNLAMDMSDPASGKSLPGAAQLGGALGVLARLRFLGPDPAAWIPNPVN